MEILDNFKEILEGINYSHKSTFILKGINKKYNPYLNRIADWDIISDSELYLLINENNKFNKIEIKIHFQDIEKIIIYN